MESDVSEKQLSNVIEQDAVELEATDHLTNIGGSSIIVRADNTDDKVNAEASTEATRSFESNLVDHTALTFEDEDFVKEQCPNCWDLVNQLRLINGNAITFEEVGNSEEAYFRFALQALAPNIYDSWVFAENNIHGSLIDKQMFKEWISTEEHKTVLSLIEALDI
jgi:hypothetical protein